MRAAFFALACILFSPLASFPAPHIPPPGIAIPDADRQELTAGAAALRKEIDTLNQELAGKTSLVALVPDVEIYHKAVDWALRYDEFFDLKQVAYAKVLLRQGSERATQLRAGHAPWLESTGVVLRAYRSRIDGSVQPYGLFVPATWNRNAPKP